MKKLLIILLLFASCKQDYQGYYIQNSTKSTMYLNLPDGNYSFTRGEQKRIVTTGEVTEKNITFEDVILKPIIFDIGTHPDKSLNITAYKHHFEVYVFGNSDSLEIWVNGKYFKDKIPFYYGDESTNEYIVKSDPSDMVGYTYTYVFIDGKKDQRFEHIKGYPWVITNKE